MIEFNHKGYDPVAKSYYLITNAALLQHVTVRNRLFVMWGPAGNLVIMYHGNNGTAGSCNGDHPIRT